MQQIEHNSQNIYYTLQSVYVIITLGFEIVSSQKWKEKTENSPCPTRCVKLNGKILKQERCRKREALEVFPLPTKKLSSACVFFQ